LRRRIGRHGLRLAQLLLQTLDLLLVLLMGLLQLLHRIFQSVEIVIADRGIRRLRRRQAQDATRGGGTDELRSEIFFHGMVLNKG
jgi:hypothetical protein